MDAANVDDAGAGGANADAAKTRWLVLIFYLSREPSRHRVAAWRRLKSLGAGSPATLLSSMLVRAGG